MKGVCENIDEVTIISVINIGLQKSYIRLYFAQQNSSTEIILLQKVPLVMQNYYLLLIRLLPPPQTPLMESLFQSPQSPKLYVQEIYLLRLCMDRDAK